MIEIDHEYTSEIVCPFCGYEHGDSWEFSPSNEDLGLMDCEDCEKSFYGTRNITIDYSTEKATYGTCLKCEKEDVVIENYNSSLGKYKGLCVSCGKDEKGRLLEEYIKSIRDKRRRNEQ